jgi:hypothetical protein
MSQIEHKKENVKESKPLSKFYDKNIPQIQEYYKVKALSHSLKLENYGKKEDIKFEIEKKLFLNSDLERGLKDDLKRLFNKNFYEDYENLMID